MNKSSKFHRLMQVLAMFLCVAMVAGTFGTANAAGGNNTDNSAKITISTPPKSIDFYNEHGESANWKPTFSLTAKIQNVAYQDGMKLILNWQEKHAGSDVFVDSPLIVDDDHPENTILSSQIKRDAVQYEYVKSVNVGSFWFPRYEYVWQDMNISLPITSADGKNVARNGAIFRCKIILVDKNNNEICSVMSNEVKVNYTVRVTLHDGEKTEDIKVPYNQAVTIPETYNQEGYVTEWQTKAAYTNKYEDFDITQGITAPVDLYVNRTKLVTVSFNMNGHGTQIPSQTFAAGQKAKEPANPQATDGYDFVEWKDAEGNKYDFSKKVNESITLTAEWETTKVKIKLYYNGHGYGDNAHESLVDYGAKNVIPTNVECQNPQTNSVHKFLGWYVSPWFNGKPYVEPENGITSDVTLYAKWGTYSYYTVSFQAGNGFTLKNKADIKDQRVLQDDYATAPTVTPVETRDGYVFAGWYADAACTRKFEFDKTKITKNTPVYAKFEKKPTVTITLHANGHGNDDSTDTIYKGNTYAVPAPLTSDDTTHDTFLGWFIDAKCTKAYEPKKINANLDLYAGWKTEYTVKFDANGKTFVGSYDDQKVVKGNSIDLPENVAEDSDKYDFTGWTLNGESVSGNFTVNSDVTFVANWKEKVVKHTVTFVAREGNDEDNPRHGFTDVRIEVEDGKLIDPSQIPADPTCRYHSDHVFGGWYTTIELTTPFNFETMAITEDIRIYSGWFTGTAVVLDTDEAKKSYTEGDTLDLTNVKILIKQKRVNGNYIVTSEIPVKADMVTNFDTVTKTAGNNKSVEVNYNNKTYYYSINVAKKIIDGSITLTDTQITKTYGTEPFAIGYTDATGDVSFESNDTKIAIVENGMIVIVGVGETTITVKVAPNGYYTATQETVTLVASPKPLSVVWDEKTLVLPYNGDEQAPKVVVEGILDGDICNVTVSGQKTNVGNDYVATVSVDSENYVIAEKDAEQSFSIVPKTVEVIWTNTELDYNGTEQGPDAALADGSICEGDEVNVTVSGKATNVGNEYVATASIDNDNYVISDNTKSRGFSIAPKTVELVWSNTELVYNGSVQKPVAALANGSICGDDKCNVTVTGGKTDAGKYTAYASLDNTNYAIINDFCEVEFTIAQKAYDEIVLDIETLVCGTEINGRVVEWAGSAIQLFSHDETAAENDLRFRRIQLLEESSSENNFVLLAPAEDGAYLSFSQDWNKVKLTLKENESVPATFVITKDLTEKKPFIGTVKGGEDYYAYLSMALFGNHTLGENTKITVTYGGVALEDVDVELINGTSDFAADTLTITVKVKAVHVPGEAVKDEESVVAATFEAEGSYDMIVKCTECGEVLSRESFPLGKLVPEIKEITFGGFDQAKKDYLIDEDLDVSGLSVEVKWTNGDVTKEDVKKEWVSGFNSKVENKALVLSVSYHGKAATYTVSVSEPAGEFVVEGDTKFNGKDNMKLHIIHTNAKRNALIFSQFGGIEMDGKVVGTVNYDATEGSIKLDIHADYLKTLTEGEHTLTVDIGEDKVDVKISVTQIKEEPTQPAQQAATSDNAPSTGDTGSLVLWYVIALIALLSAAALAVARQKSRREEF
ncbi:MAG: InlB B-repeat-containing protein [Lachnospiraceae bacterium]|nr:InlB B-repeat-containing protein [Lachnospiraceae bacterium]